MHFHLPKPLHGWREFVGEVGIILIGVFLALVGESLFEQWTWHQKVQAATHAMNQEIEAAMVDTLLADRMAKCSDAQLDFVGKKLMQKDWTVGSMKLSPVARRFYGEDAYTSAVAGQVSEHFSAEQLQTYAGLYTQIRKIRQHQEDGWTTDAVFGLLTMPGLPKNDVIQLEELNALAKLRDSLNSIRNQGELLRSSARRDLGLEVSQSDLMKQAVSRKDILDCETAAAFVRMSPDRPPTP
jgi:hypothetical protein